MASVWSCLWEGCLFLLKKWIRSMRIAYHARQVRTLTLQIDEHIDYAIKFINEADLVENSYLANKYHAYHSFHDSQAFIKMQKRDRHHYKLRKLKGEFDDVAR